MPTTGLKVACIENRLCFCGCPYRRRWSVCLAQRPEGKVHGRALGIPGGKVEPGETPEVALIRELQEELGINTWESCLRL